MLLIAAWVSLLFNQSESINLEPVQNFRWKNGSQALAFLGMLPVFPSLTADPARRSALSSCSLIVGLVTWNSKSPPFKFSSSDPEARFSRAWDVSVDITQNRVAVSITPAPSPKPLPGVKACIYCTGNPEQRYSVNRPMFLWLHIPPCTVDSYRDERLE